MKLFPRYRRPSLNTLLGITKAKRRVKKATGIAAVERIFNAPTNFKRGLLRKAGYYSEGMKLLRWVFRAFK